MSSQSTNDKSYGFNLETLTCGGKLTQLMSAFDVSPGGDAQRIANEERKKGLTGMITDAFQCDPRTCIRSNVRVATKGAEPCDPEVCREIYYCENCARCPRHCDCENDQSICESTEVRSQVDSYTMGKKRSSS